MFLRDEVLMGRKKANRSKRETIREVLYLIEILEWELPYSYSVNRHKELIDGPIWEHMSLRIKGKFLKPEKLAGKIIDFNLIGDRRLAEALGNMEKFNRQWEPNSVGTLTVRGESREYLGSLPFDILPQLACLLHTGGIKFITLSGKQLHYGSAEIRSIRFDKELSPEDL